MPDLQTWREFLAGAGATGDAAGVVGFGVADARGEAGACAGDVLADLSHLSLLAAAGPDAGRFLQALLTVDLARLPAGRAVPAALCNPEGRVAAVLRVWRRGDGWRLELPVETAAAVLAVLQQRVLRAAVTLADVSAATARLGLSGPSAADALRELLGAAPAAPGEVREDGPDEGALVALRLPGPLPRFALHGPTVRLRHVWGRLAGRARPVGRAAWTLLDILAGIPAILPPNAEAFLPQMLGLDRLGAVSFTKGCYLGQEAVATLQHRGRLPRSLWRARVAAAAAPAPGATLWAPAPGGGEPREAGRVLLAAPDATGACELLAVVRVDADEGALRLAGPDGPPLTRLPLPSPA